MPEALTPLAHLIPYLVLLGALVALPSGLYPRTRDDD